MRVTFMTGLASVGAIFLATAAPTPLVNQVWEKPIAPGLIYRMEITQDPPRHIHSLKWIHSSPVVSLSPELAGKTVYDAKTDGRRTVGQVVDETSAIAAVNVSYFGASGDPLGLVVRQSQLLSTPWPNRAIFAWGAEASVFGFSKYTGSVAAEPNGRPIEINGINEECGDNKVVLNGQEAGLNKVSKTPHFTLILKIDGGRLTPSTQIGATVISSTSDAANYPLAPGQFTLVGVGNRIQELVSLKPGMRLKLNVNCTGFDWQRLENAVGAGPMLLRNGEKFIDVENEAIREDIAVGRAPRTALGRNPDGDIVLVVIDGRQKASVGATLEETAEILRSYGCSDAMNLDGGASSTMNLFGANVNRPSDRSGDRPVAAVLAFFGPKLQPDGEPLKLVIPPNLAIDKPAFAKVVGKDNREINNIEVIWSMQGNGWIDQSGQIYPIEAGKATISAYVRGSLFTQQVVIKP